MRTDGYAPIREYALIGDGRTVALVAKDGAIDWLCLPNIDSPSVHAAILDAERGGAFTLQPAIPFDATRRYVPGTNVLETTFTTDRGAVRVVDAMTLPDERLGPMRELARSVEGLSGAVPMRWRCEPRFEYAGAQAECTWRYGVPVAICGGAAIGVCNWEAGRPAWREAAIEASFETAPGSRALLALVMAHNEPLILPGRPSIERRIEQTIRFWSEWTAERPYDGPWRDMVLRSALVLKALIFAPSGAIVAAPTTSLPEEIGGVRNWDYRFCWIRDSAFSIDALLQLGCRGEAQALFWWFMHATALTEPRLQVLYRVDGGPHATERELTTLGGYRGSRPVRIGNGAVEQSQLDIYGDLLETAWVYGRGQHRVDRDTGIVLGRIADLVCDSWREPDAGIWEVRGAPQHFTHSKVMCWVALDRAIRLADEDDVPRRHVDRWRQERAAIEQFIESRCWSARRGSYTRAADVEDLDASLLMLPLMGYGDAAGPRINGTLDAVAHDLRHGAFVYRYLADDGLPGAEGCFLNCSFWLASALARAGRAQEASDLMDTLVAQANDVGLYSEEIAPASGEFLGNFPQALVHLALIDAAISIGQAASGRPEGRPLRGHREEAPAAMPAPPARQPRWGGVPSEG